ncbi:antibiotic biosynthesis monooxygenase [Streptomyces sp. NPDC088921]|uniref:antibiotic biosynthesis monooxygenase n=1 Tax=unclassified Streptomyces TaxID=2593676 RepID=UPI0034465BBB
MNEEEEEEHNGQKTAEFATLGILRVEGPDTAEALAERVAAEVDAWVRDVPGFLGWRFQVSLDGTTVVNHGLWTGRAHYHEGFVNHPAVEPLRDLAHRPGVLGATVRTGTAAPGLTGPSADRPPGIVAVATRHLGGHDAARGVLALLAASAEWKHHLPGFISAAPYLSEDGRTFMNYPMWVDEAAYRRWMSDPRISEGQEEIARLETAVGVPGVRGDRSRHRPHRPPKYEVRAAI